MTATPVRVTGEDPAPGPGTVISATQQEENCLAQYSDMSDRENTDDLIKNHETRSRRAWVERALQGARRRLDPEAEPAPAPAARRRPRLYVVPSGRKR